MSAPGDAEPTWDVLPIPARTGEIVRYQPPAQDQHDRVTLTGTPETWADKARTVSRSALVGVFVAGPMASLGPRSVGWYMVIGAVMAAIIGIRFVLVLRHPEGGRPEVTASSEGLSLTDVHGVTRRTTWSDAGNLYLGWFLRRGVKELYVTWDEPTGEQVVSNLGTSLDVEELHAALLRFAPAETTFELGPRRPYDGSL